MPKNIVVLSDGTGQEGGVGNNTNVYKLFNMLEDRTANQITFYDRGLGTGFRKITGNISGMSISSPKLCTLLKFKISSFGPNADDGIVGPQTAAVLKISWPDV